MIDLETGLTKDELKVMDNILDCCKNYFKLEIQHPDDRIDFTRAVHEIQKLLALRIIRRLFPSGWGTVTDKELIKDKKET